ncbi:trove-domain-containing protein [Gonapodya prolifera JEL478]|uniref:Trove-domain-containing protein n=1 Tax=Gonapodya prolifera (strain JEL478) TaxID=1344416 RepID=A0A139AXR9_GONPJ|nr:trove-domain-containing protein [Gonapodya prolifera JEL478]|eukprot:KXS21245.1 trove-domain-containing protein [Gonapodya prolifera JEL478]
MASYLKNASSDITGTSAAAEATPQVESIPGREQDMSRNSAGGFTFKVTDVERLRRFLVLGAEGGTYYCKEQKLALDNAKSIKAMIDEGKGKEIVDVVTEYSEGGRTPKQDMLIFTLAMVMRFGNEKERQYAYSKVAAVCRIPTTLFGLIEYTKALSTNGHRMGGRGLRRAIGNWYNLRAGGNAAKLAFVCTKYKDRNGWTHRDMLRVFHVMPKDEEHAALYKFITTSWKEFQPTHATLMQDMEKKIEEENAAKAASGEQVMEEEFGLGGEDFEMIPSMESRTGGTTDGGASKESGASDSKGTAEKSDDKGKQQGTDEKQSMDVDDKSEKKDVSKPAKEGVKKVKEEVLVTADTGSDVEIGGPSTEETAPEKGSDGKDTKKKKVIVRKPHKPITAATPRRMRTLLNFIQDVEDIHKIQRLKNKKKADGSDEGEDDIAPAPGAVDSESEASEAEITASEAKIVALIKKWKLAREHVPSDWLSSKAVWETLLQDMPMTAMIRNLSKMTSINLLSPLSAASALVASRLRDQEALKKAKVHPYNMYIALKTYKQGRGMKGGLSWKPDQEILAALEDAFYLAFGTVGPSGKRHLLALDVSGSMGSPIMNSPVTCREATAVMAMATARIEPHCHFFGFCHKFVPLDVTKNDRLDQVERKISGLPFGSTDCSLPMMYALEKKIPVDVFIVYTDNETYYGGMHPTEALAKYRREMGIPAKMVVVAMTATSFTIADPQDVGQMDVVGFDAGAVQVMADFVRGGV